MSKTYPEFSEALKILTVALQEAAKHPNSLLRTTLYALWSVAGKGPYGTETIHALTLALTKLPNDSLAELALEIAKQVRTVSRDAQEAAEQVYEDVLQHSKLKSAKISEQILIDHKDLKPQCLYSDLARFEAILHAISLVFQPYCSDPSIVH